MSVGRSLARKLIAMPIAIFLAGGAPWAAIAIAQMSGGGDAPRYWQQPLAEQGEPPRGWTPIEQSLTPADCGQCHSAQFEQWQTSRHAHAFSSGVAGQVLAYDPADAADCLQCHAPLAEQRLAFEAARDRGAAGLAGNLAAAGNVCGGCHLRKYRHYGPPQRGTGATGPGIAAAPHGGVLRTELFESAEFCSVCHQFAVSTAVNGKPLENTFVEWQASPQAARGMVCQTCHMPDRQHLWRGIHDPAMVAAGVKPRTVVDARGVRFEITNSGVGHAFPTYITPKVIMHAVALDASDAPRPATARAHVIARDARWLGDRWIELSDTRLQPGETAAIELSWEGSDRIRTWLEVIPDDAYRNVVYPILLNELPVESDAHRLIVKAMADTAGSPFNLFESESTRP